MACSYTSGGDVGILRHIVLHDAGDGHRVPISYQVADVVLRRRASAYRPPKPPVGSQASRLMMAPPSSSVRGRPPTRSRICTKRCSCLSVLSAHQLQAMLGAAIGTRWAILWSRWHNPCKFSGHPSPPQLRPRPQSLRLLAGSVGLHAHDGVEAIHLAVLLIDDVVDGVLQPQAREQQGGAAGDADDGHEETALVAEQVSCTSPSTLNVILLHSGRDALEQDALAGLRRTRQHQRSRALAQGGSRREPGCGHA